MGKLMSTVDLEHKAHRMKLLDQLPIWTGDEFCEYYGVSKVWLYRRTGASAAFKPNIPTLGSVGGIRMKRPIVQSVMSGYEEAGQRSLKTESEKLQGTVVTSKLERKKTKLW